jgi:4-hydroxy-2-oxoheptanedioate aldolase
MPRDVLRPGGSALGLWINVPSVLSAEAAAGAGADYVVIDEQHGALERSALLALTAAIEGAGAIPLVRVAANDPYWIGSALDLGAAGVIVPLVESGDQAAAAAAACRYPPAGRRSWGRLRGRAEGEPLCLVMVETRTGLAAVDELVAAGVDGIYVGPSDLSLTLGLEPPERLTEPAVLDAIATVREACGAGLIAGVHCTNPADAARFHADGVPMVTAGADLGLLRGALADAIATAHG